MYSIYIYISIFYMSKYIYTCQYIVIYTTLYWPQLFKDGIAAIPGSTTSSGCSSTCRGAQGVGR